MRSGAVRAGFWNSDIACLAHEVYASTVLLTGYRTRCRMEGKYAAPSIAEYAEFACLYPRSWDLVEPMPAETGLAQIPGSCGRRNHVPSTRIRVRFLRGSAPHATGVSQHPCSPCQARPAGQIAPALTATMSHRGAPDRDAVTSLRLRGTVPGDG